MKRSIKLVSTLIAAVLLMSLAACSTDSHAPIKQKSKPTAAVEATGAIDAVPQEDIIDQGIDIDAEWKLTKDGVLYVDGKKGFSGHFNSDEYPWHKYADSITEVVVSDNTPEIPSLAFKYCSNLTKAELPDSVKKLGIGCFEYCEKLPSVTLSENITQIDTSAFSCCNSFTEVTVPGSIKNLDNAVFEACESLTTVHISSGVTSIGIKAFAECNALTTLYLPKTVTEIKDAGFKLTGLTDIYYEGTEDEFSRISVGGYNDAFKAATVHYQSEI